jgi:hypothetical protein
MVDLSRNPDETSLGRAPWDRESVKGSSDGGPENGSSESTRRSPGASIDSRAPRPPEPRDAAGRASDPFAGEGDAAVALVSLAVAAPVRHRVAEEAAELLLRPLAGVPAARVLGDQIGELERYQDATSKSRGAATSPRRHTISTRGESFPLDA